MENLVDLGIIGLAALIHASFQLGTGSLVLLYHESARKHVQKTTKSLVSSYIAGIGTMTFLGLATTGFLILNTFGGAMPAGQLVGIIGILLLMALIVWLFYYRRGSEGELWLPRGVAKFISGRARATENNTEAFSLGLLTSFGEIPFVAVLMLVAGDGVAEVADHWRPIVVAIYTAIAILPMAVMRMAIHKGKTAQNIQAWRMHNRRFLLGISTLGFIVLAWFILAFRVL
jgi:hypothetical protein